MFVVLKVGLDTLTYSKVEQSNMPPCLSVTGHTVCQRLVSFVRNPAFNVVIFLELKNFNCTFRILLGDLNGKLLMVNTDTVND